MTTTRGTSVARSVGNDAVKVYSAVPVGIVAAVIHVTAGTADGRAECGRNCACEMLIVASCGWISIAVAKITADTVNSPGGLKCTDGIRRVVTYGVITGLVTSTAITFNVATAGRGRDSGFILKGIGHTPQDRASIST